MFTFQNCVFQVCRNGFPSNFSPFVDWSSTSRNLQVDRPAFNGELLDVPAWENINLRHVPCEMQKLWRCVDVNGFVPLGLLEKQLFLSSSQFCGKWHVDTCCVKEVVLFGARFFFKSTCQKSRFSSTVKFQELSSLQASMLKVRGACTLHACVFFFRWENFRTFDGFFFLNSEAPSHWGETDDPPTREGK